MRKASREKEPKVDAVHIRGFGRVQLVNSKTGKVEGDSGWKGNVITQVGFQDYLVRLLGAIASSKQATVLALGTQTAAPSSTQTSLGGEQTPRKTAANVTVAGSQTLRMTANWATDEVNTSIGAIGAYNTTTGGSIANVLTFASSLKTTDQSANCTLEFRFS